MKATLRVPTQEPYSFIELELEVPDYHVAIETYRQMMESVKGGSGLSDAEFDSFIQRQISGETNHIEDYNRMSLEQQKYVQCIKRAIKRINYKVKKSDLL